MTIAYLGPEKTHTHVAALKRFGRQHRYRHVPTVEDVFHLVEQAAVDFGVVPIENSLEGAVTHTLDRFIDFRHSPVTIQGEIEQPIQHGLILHRRVSLERIKVVYSHPQALAQCRQWLNDHLPGAKRWETSSTAEAVAHLLSAGLSADRTPLVARGCGRSRFRLGWRTPRAFSSWDCVSHYVERATKHQSSLG